MSTYSTHDIARYVEGEMSTTMRQDFEQTLATNTALQQQLALYREVHATLEQQFAPDQPLEQLKSSMQGLRSEFFPAAAPPAKVVSLKRYLRSAIAIAAVFIAVLLIWRPWQPGLFQQYAPTQMIASVERGNEASDLLQQAAVAFNNKDFTTAARLLQTLTHEQPENSFAQFYYGVALLHTNKFSEARSVFSRLFQGTSMFKYEAAFYQALTYLKAGDKDNCRHWLERIPADAPNYAKAQDLLHKL
jgi:tetratricopeptide (TPR) repeat protein